MKESRFEPMARPKNACLGCFVFCVRMIKDGQGGETSSFTKRRISWKDTSLFGKLRLSRSPSRRSDGRQCDIRSSAAGGCSGGGEGVRGQKSQGVVVESDGGGCSDRLRAYRGYLSCLRSFLLHPVWRLKNKCAC